MDQRGPDSRFRGATPSVAPCLRPTLLITVGEGGKRIAAQVQARFGATYLALKPLIGLLHFDKEGLHALDSGSSATKPLSPGLPEAGGTTETQAVRLPATDLLSKTLRKSHLLSAIQEVRQAGYRVPELVKDHYPTDVYVAGSLEESFTVSNLLDMTDLVENAYQSYQDLTLTVLLVLPSENMLMSSSNSAAEARTLVAGLTERLVRLKQSESDTIHIDYCYFIDWYSLDSVMQAEAIAAAFLALLIGSGLADNRRYQELKPMMLRENVQAGSDALCGGVSCSSYILPIESLSRYCAHRLGVSLVSEGLRGDVRGEGEGGSPLEQVLVYTGLLQEQKANVSRPLAVRLMADNGLDRSRMLADLRRDEDGQPLRVALESQQMYGVPPAQLVDRVLSLDAFLGRNEMPRVQEQMKLRMAEISGRAAALLGRTVDSCVTSLPCGLQIARNLLKAMSEQVNKLVIPEDEQAPHVPDLGAYRQTLERAILQCPDRRGVLARFFVLALLGAYLAPALYALLYAEPGLLTRIALVVGVVFVGTVLAAVMILLSERRVAAAHRDLLDAIAQKYETVMDHWAREHLRGIREAISNRLREEEKALTAWETALCSAEKGLSDKTSTRYLPSSDETALVEEKDYQIWYDKLPKGGMAKLAEEYLRATDLSGWRGLGSSLIEESVAKFCLGKCEAAFQGVSLEGYLLESGRSPNEIIENLEASSNPLLRYVRRLTKVETPFRVLTVADSANTIMSPEATGHPEIVRISTGDKQRLSYVHTVHGIALMDLDIVRLLEETWPQPKNENSGSQSGEAPGPSPVA